MAKHRAEQSGGEQLEYAPRHASAESQPELYWLQVQVQAYDPAKAPDEQAYQTYVGRHRVPVAEPEEPRPEPGTATPVRPMFEDELSGALIVAPSAELPSPPAVPERIGPLRRMARTWRYAGALAGLYFGDPEKGRRRQVVAALGGLAVLGAAAWLLGAHHSHQEIQHAPSAVPEPSPPRTDFFDRLQPSNYGGETYEWGALAHQVGALHATPDLLAMIGQADSHGAHVSTWGSPSSGHWGIVSVTVPLPGGGHKTYYDTPHKLAILQWFSGQRD